MIRMNDFVAEPPALHAQELAAVERVLQSGHFILGPEGQQFEEAWARFCGARSCAGVGNGMEAIALGLRALDIGAGDEVITTPVTAMATIMAVMEVGATPVLADIGLDNALLDCASVERCLSPRTKAVLFVHLYGQIPEMRPWIDFCAGAKIHLLEDAAQAHGATRDGLHAGAFGSWAAYSFYPTKNLGAKGDAGALATNSDTLANRVKSLRNYGATTRYEHDEAGLNSRLDEMQAAILLARLPWLDQFNDRRRQIAAQYFARIKNSSIQLLSPPDEPASHVFHLFVVRCAQRDRLGKFLLERGIESLVHYPIPAHRQACCREIRIDPRGLPTAEKHAAQCLSVPCHPQLRDEEVTAIIDTLNAFA
jgi:dTDP-4-amino-4,6-dideoxygalactose transaminase